MLRMERAQGSRWGCLCAAALLSPFTLLPTLIAASTLSFHLLYWRTGHLSAHLSFLPHLHSIRSPFPLTAYFFPLLIVPQNQPSIQYCNTVVIHKCFLCRHCFTCMLIQPSLLWNCQKWTKPPKHQAKLLTKHCQAHMQRGLFTLFALFPSRKDLEWSKWKHKREVWVCLSISELHKHSQSSKT